MTRAAPPQFPLPDHRTMVDVLADEAHGCACELADWEGHQDDCPITMAFGEQAA